MQMKPRAGTLIIAFVGLLSGYGLAVYRASANAHLVRIHGERGVGCAVEFSIDGKGHWPFGAGFADGARALECGASLEPFGAVDVTLYCACDSE